MDYAPFIDRAAADHPKPSPRQRRRLLKRLVFSATARCTCGAGLCYLKPRSTRDKNWPHNWDCSAWVLGDAIPDGQPGAVEHLRYPFAFWEIKSEHTASGNGRTTRPAKG